MNESTNVSLDPSTTEIDVHISSVFTAFGIATCLWIIVSNGVIVVCFVVNRNQAWTGYSKQIFSLSLNDMILGLAMFALLLTFSHGTDYISCSISFYFFFSAQCASLYHVLGICIYRAMTVMSERLSSHTMPISIKFAVTLIASAWTVAFCLCAAPFILWGDRRREVPRCHIDFLFDLKSRKAMAFISGSYMLAMVFTNVVYMATCLKLMSLWKRIYPADIESVSVPTMSQVQCQRSTFQLQRATLGTIGALLLLFNLFTIPATAMIFMEYLGRHVSRNVRVTSSIMFAMNSAASPFVYAIRTRFLRRALKDLWKNVRSYLLAC